MHCSRDKTLPIEAIYQIGVLSVNTTNEDQEQQNIEMGETINKNTKLDTNNATTTINRNQSAKRSPAESRAMDPWNKTPLAP